MMWSLKYQVDRLQTALKLDIGSEGTCFHKLAQLHPLIYLIFFSFLSNSSILINVTRVLMVKNILFTSRIAVFTACVDLFSLILNSFCLTQACFRQ